jgi:hypothetical protein
VIAVAARGTTAGASEPSRVDERRLDCPWCRETFTPARSDAKYCSQRCRQAAWRFGEGAVVRARATHPMRLAYADPPYPGLARRYYADHPDYAGEVDHRELLSRLQAYDGFALSTNSRSLPSVLAVAEGLQLRVRVAAWFRGARPACSAWPLPAWEPVVYAGGRRVPSRAGVHDALIRWARPRTTDPSRVVGAKPAAFCYWLFALLGALPGDDFGDLYPGSGGVARAWHVYTSRAAAGDTSRAAANDASQPGPDDASFRAGRQP